MTEQLTIKLNKEKFKPLIKDLNKYSHEVLLTNSSLAAFAIWFLHDHCFHKDSNLNCTKAEFLFKHQPNTKEQVMFETIKRFNKFQK